MNGRDTTTTIESKKDESGLQQIRVPADKGIVGIAAKTGEFLNIRDAWNDPRFSNENDIKTGYRTQSILCAPLTRKIGADPQGKVSVIAVLQCINKRSRSEESFDEKDEATFAKVSTIISEILHALLLETGYQSLLDQTIGDDAKDMISQYHNPATIFKNSRRSIAGVHKTIYCDKIMTRQQSALGGLGGAILEDELLGDVPGGRSFSKTMERQLFDWNFPFYWLDDAVNQVLDYIPIGIARMNENDNFEIPQSAIRAFSESIRGTYRPVNPYHNWMHAFMTYHLTLNLLCCPNIDGQVKDIDAIATLCAALGHDSDHPGVNNDYMIATTSSLAMLYNDHSVLENHHASICCKRLQGDGDANSSIIANFDPMYRSRFRKVVIETILHTDMKRHSESVSWLQNFAINDGADEAKFDENSVALCAAVLHSADIGHVALPWKTHNAV